MIEDADNITGESTLLQELQGEQAAQLSERRRSEEQRQEFDLLVNSVIDYAIYMLDPDGRIMTWNRGAERINGYQAEEIIGQSVSVFYLPEDVANHKLERELESALRDGSYHEEGLRVRKDGTVFWADVTLTPIWDELGRHRGFGKVTRDLTERKQAEEQLQALQLLVQSVTDYAIILLKPDGQIATWNEGAQRIKGYRPDEILGKPYATFFTPEDAEGGRPQRLLKAAADLGHIEDEGWRMRQDGTRFWADAVITAIRNAQGTLIGYGKVTRDLTERKQTEERMSKLLDSLQETDRLKDQFLSILSHELRTPINAIMGFGSVLQDELEGPLNAAQHKYMAKIMGGADVLLHLVNDLLDMSRIQAGKFSLRPERVDFRDVVAEALAILTPLAEQKQQKLETELGADLPVFIADAQRVGQVLLNLVTNAIKFTPKHGEIRVRARLVGAALRCEIEDSGIGIAEEHLPKLFQRFSQLDSSNTRSAGGTGLGLSISKALVEAHGGTLGVSSALGRGSTFWFELPLEGPPDEDA